MVELTSPQLCEFMAFSASIVVQIKVDVRGHHSVLILSLRGLRGDESPGAPGTLGSAFVWIILTLFKHLVRKIT